MEILRKMVADPLLVHVPYQRHVKARLILNHYYSIPFNLFPYHMNQDQFNRDKLYYKTVGLIRHDRYLSK